MAVYTDITNAELTAFLSDYNIGSLKSYRGIAEGVENTEQSNELKGLTIGFGQGWLFGKPQSADALAKSVQDTQ